MRKDDLVVRIAGLILGIIGGLAGLGGSVFALFVGGVGAAFNAEGANQVIGLGFVAIPLSLLGIIGGALSLGKPKLAGILMIISAIGGTIAISAAYTLAAIILFIGGVCSLIGQKELTKEVTALDEK